MIRKWYFTLSESSINRPGHGWRGLIRVAVKSALQNTTLTPHLVYDGEVNDFILELIEMGVVVIYHRVSFYDALSKREESQPGYLAICSAVFLRVDLPLIETSDEFIFFSDCDVVFLRDPDLSTIVPNTFAAAPQFDKTNYRHDMNAGVMVMNLPALRADLPIFKKFIVEHLYDGWPGCDQENYRRFYNGNWGQLALELNWKPYWGVNQNATLLHWHGPKPRTVRDLLRGHRKQLNADFIRLFEQAPDSYASYYKLWLGLASGNRPTSFGHIDRNDSGVLAGWVLNEDDIDKPLTLYPVIDGKKMLELHCDQKRSDLKSIYDVDHGGFTVNIPPEVLDGDQHTLQFFDTTSRTVELKVDGKLEHNFIVSHNKHPAK